MIIDKVSQLCRENKTNFAEVERALSFGSGTIRKWSTANPGADKLIKIADLFGVSVDELLDRPTFKPSEEASNIAKLYDSLPVEKQGLIRCYISVIKSN